MNINSTAMN